MANLVRPSGVGGSSCGVLVQALHSRIASVTSPTATAAACKHLPSHCPIRTHLPQEHQQRRNGRRTPVVVAVSSRLANDTEEEAWSPDSYQALLRGGEDVASVMKTMTELLEDIQGLDPEDEAVALELAAAGAIGQKLDSLDGSFLLALDWMIRQADSEQDEKRKQVLEIIKDSVLGQLSDKCPPHVQIIGMLCQTPTKEKRHEVLRRSAGGGGVFDTESGGKLTIPNANLNDVAIQADNLLAGIEEKPRVQDRRLLAKLVLVREEARSMLGGGLLDKRNDNRGFKNLPGNVVKFISKLVSVRPGPALRERISNVMNGKEEGEDPPEDDDEEEKPDVKRRASGSKKKVPSKFDEELPVRPGIFLEAITKVLGGMYETNTAGVGVQQLEWIHRETLEILEDIGYS